jgi:hypothetical protein
MCGNFEEQKTKNLVDEYLKQTFMRTPLYR